MPYKPGTRDRVEGWPTKGTKRKLKAAAKARKKKFLVYVNEVLEKAAAT